MAGIPSYLVLLGSDNCLVEPQSCWDVTELIQEAHESDVIWEFIYENEWQNALLEKIISSQEKRGLAYLFSEVHVLGHDEIDVAIDVLGTILEGVASNSRLTRLESFNQLLHASEQNSAVNPTIEITKAMGISSAQRNVDEDNYRSMLVAFFCFLLSHRQALNKARELRNRVLFVQFQG
ncbi:hypothetical protein [Collimonas fungivorans]|uniref:hypothetical protein n=1 Tax=Collimonas fungivorans TaxID=158899 RepID=UPI000A61FCFE|nr:hypothetical protein [Collimonas fungivorans]